MMWSVDRKYFDSTLRSSPGLRWKRERDEARVEVERLRAQVRRLLALENGDWRARYSDASRDVERLREALAFYADPATYQAMAPRDDALDGIVPIKADRGERARVVLDG
jgi:hypothetical protein